MPTHRGGLHRAEQQACLLALLTLACYLPAIHGPWLFDDQQSIAQNPLITQAGHLAEIWCSTKPIDYWPLSYTAFWLQWRLWGDHTTGYHLVNLALHIASAWLAWRVLARLNIRGAWAIALLFAVHPVNVESAAWIFQQKTTLAAALCFGSLWAWLVFDDTRDRRYYLAALGLFLLAMLAKTSVVALPLFLLCCAWWRRGRVSRNDLVLTAPFFAVALVLGLVSIWFQTHRAIGEIVVREDGPLARLAGAGWSLWFYLLKALWPVSLSFVYPKWQIDGASLAAHLPWLAWLGMVAATWRWRRSWGRPVLFALAWFFLMLAPVLGFVNIGYMRYSLVADHWQYLAILAPLGLLVAGAIHLAEHHGPAVSRQLPRLAAAAVAVCCLLTWRQAHCYRSEIALWTDTLEKNPTAWMARTNLSLALARQNELPAAEAGLREALRIAPGDPTIQSNLAIVLNRLKQFDEAISLAGEALRSRPHDFGLCLTLGTAHAGRYQDREAHDWLTKALSLRPQDALAHLAMGKLLLRQGETRAAEEHFRQSIAINSREAEPYVGLAQCLTARSLVADARKSLDTALSLEPLRADAHLQLANLLAAEGRLAEAARLLTDAVFRSPDSAELHAALAERLVLLGQHEQAWRHAQQALQLDASVPEIHAAAGDVRAAQGQSEEAIAHFLRAVKLNPNLAEAHKSLGGLLAAAGRADQAIEHCRHALRLRPAWPAVSSHLAWLLASRPEATPEEKQEALSWAQQACRETGHTHPVALDTLAVVSAALGEHESAAAAAQQAHDRAAALGQREFAQSVQARLERYRTDAKR